MNEPFAIDPEISNMLMPLPVERLKGLEESIKQHGCRDPLLIWTEQGILLDGHNRLSICKKLGLPYTTEGISLPDRDAALNFVDAHQLNRRNLNPAQMRLVLGRLHERRKGAVGGQLPRKGVVQNDPPLSTAAAIAKEHGTSEATVKRAAQFAKAVEKVKETDPEIEQKIAAGDKEAIKTVAAVAKPQKPTEPLDVGDDGRRMIDSSEVVKESESLFLAKKYFRACNKREKALFMVWATDKNNTGKKAR